MVRTGLKLVLHDLLKMIIQIRLHTMPTLSHNDYMCLGVETPCGVLNRKTLLGIRLRSDSQLHLLPAELVASAALAPPSQQ